MTQQRKARDGKPSRAFWIVQFYSSGAEEELSEEELALSSGALEELLSELS